MDIKHFDLCYQKTKMKGNGSMKKRVYHIIAIILLLTFLVGIAAGCSGDNSGAGSSGGGSSQEQTGGDDTVYKLSLSTHDPTTSNKTKYHQEWADRIFQDSGGRLEITIYSDGVLAPGTGALDAVRTGVCDIAWIFPIYWPGQFPMSEIITLPLGITTVPQATNILWDLWESDPDYQAEVNEFIPLQIHANPVSIIGSVNRPIRAISDLAGMTLRAPGGTPTDSVLAWGGNPLMLAPGDIYQAVERSTIDGYIFEYSGIVSFGLQEVTNYFTEVPIYLGPYYLFMNKTSYNSLPPDLQDILMRHSTREESLEMAYVFEADWNRGRNAAIDAGATIITAEEANADAFVAVAYEALVTVWVENNSRPGFDAQAYADRAKALAEQYFISRDELNATLAQMGY
jgi:TRAP-type C4-dicarboxylate transport system substrate-binding protein